MLKWVVLALSVATVPASADQSSTAPDKSPRFGVQRPSPADPYRKLFELRKHRMQPALEAKLAESKPTVVCGTTLIPADPKIDPKMVLPRYSRGVDYRIRAIDPPICNSSK